MTMKKWSDFSSPPGLYWYWNLPMISNHDLIIRTKEFLHEEPTSPYATMIQGIINSYHHWDEQLTKLQHTMLTQFCISCEWREEEARLARVREERNKKRNSNFGRSKK